MKDLSSSFWIKLKGILFLIISLTAATLLFLDLPTWRTAVLLVVAIWSFCRFYYFAFYVIPKKYVDPSYKFSGLIFVCEGIGSAAPATLKPAVKYGRSSVCSAPCCSYGWHASLRLPVMGLSYFEAKQAT